VAGVMRRSMFLPFVSVGQASGVGLGLTLAQQIAQEHGGDIQYSRSPQGYTLFTIIFPIAALSDLAPALPISTPEHAENLT
jgi:nitrogen-specific signal transduction histidine kinase